MRKTKMKTTAMVLAGAVAALSMSSANALVVQFFNGADLFATLTTTGGTDFELYFDGVGVEPGGYIDYINLAGPGGTFVDSSVDTDATGTYDADGFNDAGDTYNWQVQFPNANNAFRLNIGETALWSITATDSEVWNFNLVHINAFNADGDSIKLDGCIDCDNTEVPEPGTLALLGLGLLGLGASRRRFSR